MKFRVLDLTNGCEVVLDEPETFTLLPNGVLGILDKNTGKTVDMKIEGGHIVDFAFQMDDNLNWMYTHSVVHD